MPMRTRGASARHLASYPAGHIARRCRGESRRISEEASAGPEPDREDGRHRHLPPAGPDGGVCEDGWVSSAAVRVQRLLYWPIISAELHPSIGLNIQGPSLIRTPDWIEDRLGDYYLDLADHKGRDLRLAYADRLTGPWTVYPPGSLQLDASCFLTEPPAGYPGAARAIREARQRGGHHALPRSALGDHDAAHRVPGRACRSERAADHYVFSRPRRRRHAGDAGGDLAATASGSTHSPEVLGRSYMRVFRARRHDLCDWPCPASSIARKMACSAFEPGPMLFNPRMRHSAVLKRGDGAVGLLDAGRRRPRANSVEPHRPFGRLARLEGKCSGRDPPAGACLGGCRGAARALDPQHRLWTGQPAPRSGDPRRGRAACIYSTPLPEKAASPSPKSGWKSNRTASASLTGARPVGRLVQRF